MKKRCSSAILLLFLLGACRRDQVEVYQIPKEVSTPPPLAQESQPARKITWTTPKEWQEQPLTEMRQGSFLVTSDKGAKVDISVSGFPGDTGGDLANVNRWRGQINLPLLDDAGLEGTAQKIEMGGEPASQFELEEKPDHSGRKIFAVILHHGGGTWFFKMMGDSALVTAQQATFADFLESVRFAADAAPGAQPQDNAQPPFLSPPAVEGKLKWTLPPGWQEQPAGGMRVGSFLVTEGKGKADISVVTLSGEAGGVLANINRWRKQLLLSETTETGLPSLATNVDSDGTPALIVDMVSDVPLPDTKIRTRILGAIIERGGNTWFVKMTGEDSLVKKHKAGFLDFVKSLKFPDHG
jgi:hypothetical protein